MIYARSGNKVLRIEEPQISEFLERGFDIIDEKGSVLKKAVPTDPGVLRKAYIDNTKRIEELEKELADLKKSSKKTVAKETTTVEEEKAEINVEPTESTKPKRTSKKDK